MHIACRACGSVSGDLATHSLLHGLACHVHFFDSQAIKAFEEKVKGSVDLVRYFAFDANDGKETVGDVKRKKLEAHPSVVVLPPGLDASHLAGQLEIVMHDFAASMLNVLEQKILTVSPSTISLESYVDSAAFLGSGLSAVVFSTEDDASRTKRKYGRVQKAMGDYALLAGSPLDALDHYNTALELARAASDWVYVASALEGVITSKMVHEATSRDAFPPLKDSVFQNEGRWGAVDDGEGENSGPGERDRGTDDVPKLVGDDAAGTMTEVGDMDVGKNGGDVEARRAEASTSTPFANSLDPFKQQRLWKVLEGSSDVLEEVSKLLDECKAAIRKRSALPLLVESELRYARLLAGLKGSAAREKVCKLVGSVQRAAEILHLPEDRLVALIEAADVLGSVGATRKRVLLLWQAVELSKYFGFPEEKSLAVARRALELHEKDRPAGSQHARNHVCGDESEWAVFRKPLSQDTNIPDSWGLVKAGILEATLGLAIYANRHADVWDAASALLREHSALLSPHRIRSLYDNLKAASLNMPVADKMRPDRGPPPIVYLVGPKPLDGDRKILVLQQPGLERANRGHQKTSTNTPFLYDALTSKKKEQRPAEDAEQRRVTRWIQGETGSIDLELYNESPVTMKIARLVLLANIDGMPATKAQWKPKVVSLTVPPTSRPVRITLEATPLVEGEFTLTGCRMTSSEGVSWMAPWSERPVSTAKRLADELRPSPGSDDECAKLLSLPPQPMATLSLVTAVRDLTGVDTNGPEGGQDVDDGADDSRDAGGDGEEGEEGGGKPRGTDAPSAASCDAQAAEKVQMLRGHKSKCMLRFSNSSGVRIDGAAVRVLRRSPGQNESSPLGIDAHIPLNPNDQMPLAPGASIYIPVELSSEVLPMAVGSDAVSMASFDVSVEYWANSEHPSEAAGPRGTSSASIIGRMAHIQLDVSILPSIELSDVSVKMVYGPERCLLLAGVVNRSSCPLSAVCCALEEPNKPGMLSSDSTRGSDATILPGEQRVLELELTADVFDRVVIRFGRTLDALHGAFALPEGAIRGTLTPYVLSMLRPHNISASITLACCEIGGISGMRYERKEGAGGGPMQKHAIFDERGALIIADASEIRNWNAHGCSLPIFVARIGDPLTVTVEFKSDVSTPCTARYTVCAEPIAIKSIGDDATSRTPGDRLRMAIVPNGQDVQDGWATDSALDLGMAWNGVVMDAEVELPANASATQDLFLSCWTPGWFKLELSDVGIHSGRSSRAEDPSGFVSASLSAVSAEAATSTRVFPAFLRILPDE